MVVRRVVELEDAVDRTLALIADGHDITVEQLLTAAARHVARVQGGLREPVYRLRAADVDIPEPEPEPDLSEWIPNAERRRLYNLTPRILECVPDVVRMYRDEGLSIRRVADRVNMSAPTVRRVLIYAEVQIRRPGPKVA